MTIADRFMNVHKHSLIPVGYKLSQIIQGSVYMRVLLLYWCICIEQCCTVYINNTHYITLVMKVRRGLFDMDIDLLQSNSRNSALL